MDRLKRGVFPLLVGVAGYYALFGGEYSWWELRQLRAQHQEQTVELERMARELDSLRGWEDKLLNDPATLERLAREDHGLVGEGEILYWVVGESDSTEVTGPER